MKTTIELTASPRLLESVDKLLCASTNLLEAVKLLNLPENSKICETNILTDQLNKACVLLSSCGEKAYTSSLRPDIHGDPAPQPPIEHPLDIKTIRALAKATKTDSTIAPLDIKTIRALAKEKCKTAGLQAVKNLITNLGVNHLESLPQNKYQDLLNQLQAL